MKKIFLLFITLTLSLSSSAQENFWSKFTLQGTSGFQYTKGSLFEHDSTIQEHPARLGGLLHGIDVDYDVKKHFFVGAGFSRSCDEGSGSWLRQSQEATDNQVSGTASGRTIMCESRIEPFVGVRLSPGKYVLSLKGGPVLEKISTNFSGTFYGVEQGQAFVQPGVSDRDITKTPGIMLDGNVERRFGGFYVGPGIHWELGRWTAYVGIRFNPFHPLASK